MFALLLGDCDNPINFEENKLIRDFIYDYFPCTKYLHNFLRATVIYDYHFFIQGIASVFLHFDALETEDLTKNTITEDFYRDSLREYVDEKRIASCYQTLSFYDYDYFYQDKAQDETAVDF